MTTLIDGSQLLALAYGTAVYEPAKTLPATGIAHLFTVTGGRVLVTSLIGRVTTVCSGTATTVSVGATPTTGTAAAASMGTATAVTSLEVGSNVTLPPTQGALKVGANAGSPVQVSGDAAYVVNPGTIDITTSATNTGAMDWILTYIPLDAGASVAAV